MSLAVAIAAVTGSGNFKLKPDFPAWDSVESRSAAVAVTRPGGPWRPDNFDSESVPGLELDWELPP